LVDLFLCVCHSQETELKFNEHKPVQMAKMEGLFQVMWLKSFK